jgi:hypothetical protein
MPSTGVATGFHPSATKEVWLAQKDGRIYGLESSKIDRNAHLGHKVIVTGYVLPESKEEPAKKRKNRTKPASVKPPTFVCSR